MARLDRLSGELLAMTQRRTPRPEPVDLAALLAACAEEHRGQADAAGVEVRVRGGGAARLDPALVRRVLDDLVVDAIRHTPSGGRVTLLARREGERVRLAVEDTGPGVDPALRDGLFEPFVTGRPDGTGLGLAIAREAAEAQGGALRLDRAGGGGEGACFVAESPVDGVPGAAQGATPEAEQEQA